MSEMELVRSENSRAISPDLKLVAFAVAAGLAVAIALFALSGVLPKQFADNPWMFSSMTLGALVAGVILAFRPGLVFPSFVFTSMVIPMVLEETFIPLGFMKLYIQDAVFVFNAALIALRWSIGKIVFRRMEFNRYILLYFGFGATNLILGYFVRHNEFDNAFGDFRRAFFYFMNYFVAILLAENWEGARKLRTVLWAGGIAIAANGVFQFLTGTFYYRRFGDAAHILSHYELTFMSFALFYALAQLFFGNGKERLIWIAVFAITLMITVIGNYRAAWLSVIGGMVFVFLYLPGRKKWMLAFIALLACGFLALAVFTAWDVPVAEGNSTLGEELSQKANIGATTEDVNVIWRFQSYENAIERWKEHPVLGTGLGTYLEFSASTSTGGAMWTEGHRVHNSFLWLLMCGGIVGFAVVVAVFGKYMKIILTFLRTSQWDEGRMTVMACGAFFISFMISTTFEIFLESAMPITVLSASMALAMLTIYYAPKTPGVAAVRD